MSPILVSAAILEHDGKILLAQRDANSRFGAEKWEFPGGKVELLESPKQALKREINEELGIGISDLWLVDVNSHIYEDEQGKLHIILISYRCKPNHLNLIKHAHKELKWVKPTDIDPADLCEADKPILISFINAISALKTSVN